MRSNAVSVVLVVLGLISLAIAGVLGLSALTGGTPLFSSLHVRPPVLFTLPDFQLTNQHSQAVSSEDLGGKCWIADFMFTRCGGVCPVLSGAMAKLQSGLADHPQWDRIRLVSLSVDSENDTPQVLRDYAHRWNADPEHWFFLSGPREKVWTLIESGFKQAVAEAPSNVAIPFTHSPLFALVDQLGRVRGYYDGRTAEGQAQLLQDLNRILAER